MRSPGPVALVKFFSSIPSSPWGFYDASFFKSHVRRLLLSTPVDLVAFWTWGPCPVFARHRVRRGKVAVQAYVGARFPVQGAFAVGIFQVDVGKIWVVLTWAQTLGIGQIPFTVQAHDDAILVITGFTNKCFASGSTFCVLARTLRDVDMGEARRVICTRIATFAGIAVYFRVALERVIFAL